VSIIHGADSTELRQVPKLNPADRRLFIGGSDARVIMGADQARLIRLCREKRGEIEPEPLHDNLMVQLVVATKAFKRLRGGGSSACGRCPKSFSGDRH